jgi:HlyD family secretion protein
MNSDRRSSVRGIGKLIIGLATVAVIMFVFYQFRGGPEEADAAFATAEVQRGNLVIDVLESGNLEASESLEIKSKVEGRTTIISIVPEGTIITNEDIEKGTVLVELDSSDLRNRLAEQEISLDGAEADYTESRESYEIQVNQNESDKKKGELDAKFARMDLEKYLGESLIDDYLAETIPLEDMIPSEELGGEALQKRRELSSEIELASEEVMRAEDKVEWTRKLADKGYVTENEYEADQLALKRQEVALDKARTALDLFKRYEFPKEAEKLRSDYEEAQRELERIIAKNRAELSKADARLKSASATFVRKSEELKRLQEQIQNCTIRATKPGLVVYAGSDHPWRGVNIQEGAEVHENMDILKIPDSSTMVVKTKIHESMIARVHEGQEAFVTVDALPDEVFEGKVTKVGIVPDSQNRWMNPDLKVYLTDVTITGSASGAETTPGPGGESRGAASGSVREAAANGDLKPGMSAQVRVIIEELKDVLKVPLEAVATVSGEKVCYAVTPSGPVKRPVETGDYSDVFIEIVKGLEEGDTVVLNPSSLVEESKIRGTGRMPAGPEPRGGPPESDMSGQRDKPEQPGGPEQPGEIERPGGTERSEPTDISAPSEPSDQSDVSDASERESEPETDPDAAG